MENQNVNVNENKGELTLFSGIKQNVYCSKVAETEKEKKELFQILTSTFLGGSEWQGSDHLT